MSENNDTHFHVVWSGSFQSRWWEKIEEKLNGTDGVEVEKSSPDGVEFTLKNENNGE